MAPRTKLSVYLGDKLIHQQVLEPGDYIIGKDDKAGIRVEADKVGSRHARLKLGPDHWVIEDLGSQSGTFVNGAQVTNPASVSASDTIRVGAAQIVMGAASAESVPPPVSVTRPEPEEIRGPRRYEMGPVIARGGMGLIQSARQVVVQREVAMKLMHDSTKPESVTRFFQEAQITAQLEHPNIVPIHELSINEHGQPFYTMKLVRGVSLKDVIDRLAKNEAETIRQWPLTAMLTVFQKICDALAFAHARGVIHRDLKPDNIMLGEYGEALVMDWGIAKLLTRGGTQARIIVPSQNGNSVPPSPHAAQETVGSTVGTSVGSVLGTPQYMPPEQANGEIELMDERTDIYSLGAILYHLLTLTPPFQGRNGAEVLLNVRAGKIIPFEEACEGRKCPHLPGGKIPKSLAAVVLQAMAFEKADRYKSVKELQADIEAYQSGFATSAENASLVKLASLFVQRHRTIAIAAAVLLLAGVIFTINLVHERNRAESASRQAVAARKRADAQRNVAEDQLYLSDLLQAGRHAEDGRPDIARSLLQRHRMEPSGRDLRGWEWFYSLGQVNQERLRVLAHPGGVFTVVASPDGARLATGGADGDIAIWQSRGLVPEFRLRKTGGIIQSVSWHPDGKLLASCDSLGVVRVWNLESRTVVAEATIGTGQPLRCVAWRPNDAGVPVLAIGGLEKEIYTWQPQAHGGTATPQVLTTVAFAAASLSWSLDGHYLAVGQLNEADPLLIFDSVTNEKRFSAPADAGGDIFTVAFDPTGAYVATGSKHLTVNVYEVSTKKRTYDERVHRGFVSALAWAPDGKKLASASHDGTIRIFSPVQKTPKPGENVGPDTQIFSGHEGEVNALTWIKLPLEAGSNTSTTALFSGGADGTLRAWAAETGASITTKPGNWISAASWSPDGRRIAIANFGDVVFIADPSTGLSYPIRSTAGNVFDVAWSPAGDRLATSSRGRNQVEVLDSATGLSAGVFPLDRAYRVAWSASGRYLAGAGPGGVRVWDTRSGATIASIARPVGVAVWSPDEKRIVLGGDDGSIQVWDPFAGKMTEEWRRATPLANGMVVSDKEPPRQVFDLRWSPDGRWLAFVTQESVAGVIDKDTGKVVRTLPGHSGGIWRVCWSPDGRRLATAGQDGVICVYDSITGGEVARLSHGDGSAEVHALDWSPDGRQLISGGFDYLVRVWDSQRGEWIQDLERLSAKAKQRPDDLSAQKSLADTYAKLGWAEDARRAFVIARALAPGDVALNSRIADAETIFAQTLDVALSGALPSKSVSNANPRAMKLLNEILSRWEGSMSAVSAENYRELGRIPGGEEFQPIAVSYFSHANWRVIWFPSTVDPEKDLKGWRDLANGPNAVPAGPHVLAFPYLRRGPKSLALTPLLAEKGPSAGPFGMIAHSKLGLPPGKWRFRATGGDGVRVIVDGKTLIEKWGAGPLAEGSAVFEKLGFGDTDLVVENFVTKAADSFQFLIEPETQATEN